MTDDDLDRFHQDDTLLAGHPPARGIPDIRFATGSLGHGLSLAAGLALAARLQGANRRVFCLTSDGEWQEGSTLEAAIFAAHHRFNNLTILVDHNRLQGFGSTDAVASMNPLHERLSGLDFEIRRVRRSRSRQHPRSPCPGPPSPSPRYPQHDQGTRRSPFRRHHGKPLPAFDRRAIRRRDGAVRDGKPLPAFDDR